MQLLHKFSPYSSSIFSLSIIHHHDQKEGWGKQKREEKETLTLVSTGIAMLCNVFLGEGWEKVFASFSGFRFFVQSTSI